MNDPKHNSYYGKLKERSAVGLKELTGQCAITETGMHKALCKAMKHGTAEEKAKAMILAFDWIHAHNELEERE